jgi:hypothetical protein
LSKKWFSLIKNLQKINKMLDCLCLIKNLFFSKFIKILIPHAICSPSLIMTGYKYQSLRYILASASENYAIWKPKFAL